MWNGRLIRGNRLSRRLWWYRLSRWLRSRLHGRCSYFWGNNWSRSEGNNLEMKSPYGYYLTWLQRIWRLGGQANIIQHRTVG